MNIERLYELYLQYPSVQTDTRKLKPGDIFFALKGPNFNANEFAGQALQKGAAYAVVDEVEFVANEQIILVNDVLDTLQQLAKHHRKQFTIPFIAITGSNGKTTTKELIHTVLATTYKTYTTQGNLNNHIGVPLTILGIKKDAQMAVIEMGANHQKEIESYCQYTLPTHGIITNCGKAHLEGFGSIEGVRKAKGELYDFLRRNNGTVFVMWDYDYLQEMSKGIPTIISYGTKHANVVGRALPGSAMLQVEILKGAAIKIESQLIGDYNLPNILAAVTVAKHFEINDNTIKKAIDDYQPSNSRSQLIDKDSNKIILDAYNANPSSMKAAIENFATIDSNNKVLMLGAMAELGADSVPEHENIINLIKAYPWKEVVLVGGDFLKADHPFIQFENALQAAEWYNKQQFEKAWILIKGSRSMQMEKILS